MLTEKNYRDFCDEETENELVKLGFPIEHACLQGSGIYVTIHISLYEAQKWLREEKKLFVEITIEAFDQTYLWEIYSTENSILIAFGDSSHNTYEEALSEGIKEAIKILKENETIHR